ncbi:hypothetical protein TW84_03250 [Vibrio neptunius]|nr:hypothetical protein [Vibrio neptunius]KJY93636.1 hypothetical protein TW84_03250 [Vibrio neptunius]
MKESFKKAITLLVQWLVFIPILFCFSYVLRPILMSILIPGGLLFLAIIGGAEVRKVMKKMLMSSLTK